VSYDCGSLHDNGFGVFGLYITSNCIARYGHQNGVWTCEKAQGLWIYFAELLN
jgi:hypothetical protein